MIGTELAALQLNLLISCVKTDFVTVYDKRQTLEIHSESFIWFCRHRKRIKVSFTLAQLYTPLQLWCLTKQRTFSTEYIWSNGNGGE